MIDHLLEQTCAIDRWATRERDADFRLQPTWTAVASAEPCMIQQKTGRMTIGPSGTEVAYDAVGYFNQSADIKPRPQDPAHGDRLTCSGVKYIVQAVLDQTGQEALKKALLKVV